MDDLTELANATYVSLRTFRKSGVAVDTPVWCVQDNDVLAIFSAGHAGKVKRLHGNANAQLAKCGVRGKLLGDWIPARATLISAPDDVPRILATFRAKYGWQMWLADIGARLTGKMAKRAYIRVELE